MKESDRIRLELMREQKQAKKDPAVIAKRQRRICAQLVTSMGLLKNNCRG